jgi:uncharacterized C2H2 Zn-finger protein
MSVCVMFVEEPTWEIIGLGKQRSWTHESLLMTAFPKHRKGIWLLKTSIVGNYCISCPEGKFTTLVGDLTCLGQKVYNDTAQETQWWGAPNHTKLQPHPLANFCYLQRAQDNFTANIDWRSPRGLYWICGKQGYMVLRRSWFGSCVLGSTRTSFFLLPLRQGEKLGVPRCEERLRRQKQSSTRVNHPVLWSCHLGRREVLGLLHPYVYAQLQHQAAG